MKPLKLEFKGINSFSETTTIDFGPLVSSGIFGIFGDTGSGKSTILDCISFALYGNVERSREKADIINYNSDMAEVKFEFDILQEGKRQKYLVERSIKRKSGIHKAMLYQVDQCIADSPSTVTKKITEILGVDADDFSKCIALPQGEFSQFVKSQASERVALIERLFSLSRYGDRLKEKLKARENECNITFTALSARLEGYSNVTAEAINESEEKLKDALKDLEKLKSSETDAENKLNVLKNLSEKKRELDDTSKKLDSLLAKKPEMERIRSGLNAIPICRNIVECEKEISSREERLKSIKAQLSENVKKINSESDRLKKDNEILNATNFDDEIAKCTALDASYKSCEGKSEKFKRLEKELKLKREEYQKKAEKLKALRQRLAKAEENREEVEKNISSLQFKSIEDIINLEFKGAVLKNEYVYNLDYFVGLKADVDRYKDNSYLYEFISEELKERVATYKERVYNVKDYNMARAEKNLLQFQSLSEKRESLTKLLNEKKLDERDITSDIKLLLAELETLKKDGESLRAQADETKGELDKVYGKDCSDYSLAERQNKENIEKLKSEKTKLNAEIANINSTISDLTAKNAVLSAEQTVSEEFILLNTKKLDELVLSSGFKDLQSCKQFILGLEKYSDSEKELVDYDEKLIALSARVSELEKIDGVKDFSFEALKSGEDIKQKISANISYVGEQIAVLRDGISRNKTRLEEKKGILKEYKLCEKERNLVAQLKEITRGNKFMEYIANEYLSDISSLASKTLLNLTDGRYFLVYTDSFYVGDNFNSGNLRGVNTLSGGETFLVSLSLALALSQTICSKSLKSIEFFFLDEGFGTLDSNLCDTVMTALEKLKSKDFTIGIISHVEELKHRIDSKITVTKATQAHGSRVQISL